MNDMGALTEGIIDVAFDQAKRANNLSPKLRMKHFNALLRGGMLLTRGEITFNATTLLAAEEMAENFVQALDHTAYVDSVYEVA